MRLLIVSSTIHDAQRYADEYGFKPPNDVELDTDDLNTDDFSSSIFDYDVSIIHIESPVYHSIGYYNNLPKLAHDFEVALGHPRCVICMPHSADFVSHRLDDRGMRAYEWLSSAGVELNDNMGENIKPSKAGQSQVVKEYLKVAPKYYQTIVKPQLPLDEIIAVVGDTEIAVGIDYTFAKGNVVILPPPILNEQSYCQSLTRLIEVARRFYDRSQRKIKIIDEPEWLNDYLIPHAKEIIRNIEKLTSEKANYDNISYVLYGTGHDLENSVGLLFKDIGFEVEPQPKGANYDLKITYPSLNLGFAIEVTGTRNTVNKDNNKISQAWQYINERSGTPDEDNRLVVVANTQCHIEPKKRDRSAFSHNVIELLGNNGVLLMTTYELYGTWAAIHEGTKSPDEFARQIYNHSGLFSSI